MKFNKIIWILALFFSVNICFGVLTDAQSYLSMDNEDISGSTIADLSGNSNTGTINGTVNASGKINQALQFDGVNDYVSYPDNAFDSHTVGTINLWFYLDDTTGNKALFALTNPSATNPSIDFQVIGNQIRIFMRNNAGVVQLQATTSTLTAGNWYMFTFTMNSSNNIAYLNGVEETLTYSTGSSATHFWFDDLASVTTKYTIGAVDWSNAGFGFFDPYEGKIDEVAVYDRALSTTEVEEFYSNNTGYNPYSTSALEVNILNITANDVLFVNNTVFGVNDITFNVTYEVNNSDIGNFTNSSITELTDLTNGSYYIQFEVCYNTTCDTSGNYSYTVNVTKNINFNTINLTLDPQNNSGRYQELGALGSTTYLNYSFSGDTDIMLDVILENISTNGNVNVTLYPNINQFITNGLSGNIEFGFTGDGSYDIYLFAENNETNKTTANYTFIVDTTNPVISHNIPTEINTYNLTGIEINVTDTNFDTCIFTFNSANYTCSAFTAYNFTYNGYYNWSIYANDSAGNSVTETGQLLVSPPFYVYFESLNTTQITNFKVNGTDYVSYFTGNIYDYGLGNHTFTFSKLGFEDTNFTLQFTNTSDINTTVTISNAYILIKIYDRNTGLLITENVSIVLVGTVGYNETTSTGIVNISSISLLDESYQVIASSDNYESESVYFNFDNREIQQVDIYMLKSNQTNIGTHTVRAITDTGLLVNGAICKALEWKPALSSFVSTAQGLTDSNGETILNVELGTKLYKFQCTKGSSSATSSSKIIGVSGTTTTVELATTIVTPPNIFADLTYTLTNTTINSTHQRITFTWSDGNGLIDIGCLKIYKVVGTKYTLLQTSCVSSSSTSTQLIQNVNQTYLIKAVASINIDGVITELDYIDFDPNNTLEKSLQDYGLDIILPLLFILLGVSIGFLIKPQTIYVSIVGVITGAWLSVVIVPSVISGTIASFATLVSLIILWGSYKHK